MPARSPSARLLRHRSGARGAAPRGRRHVDDGALALVQRAHRRRTTRRLQERIAAVRTLPQLPAQLHGAADAPCSTNGAWVDFDVPALAQHMIVEMNGKPLGVGAASHTRPQRAVRAPRRDDGRAAARRRVVPRPAQARVGRRAGRRPPPPPPRPPHGAAAGWRRGRGGRGGRDQGGEAEARRAFGRAPPPPRARAAAAAAGGRSARARRREVAVGRAGGGGARRRGGGGEEDGRPRRSAARTPSTRRCLRTAAPRACARPWRRRRVGVALDEIRHFLAHDPRLPTRTRKAVQFLDGLRGQMVVAGKEQEAPRVLRVPVRGDAGAELHLPRGAPALRRPVQGAFWPIFQAFNTLFPGARAAGAVPTPNDDDSRRRDAHEEDIGDLVDAATPRAGRAGPGPAAEMTAAGANANMVCGRKSVDSPRRNPRAGRAHGRKCRPRGAPHRQKIPS